FVASDAPHLSPMFRKDGTPEARMDVRETDPCDATPLTDVLRTPLLVRGATIGSLRLAHASSGRSFDALDRALAEDLARRLSACVENARLYETSQAERPALE